MLRIYYEKIIYFILFLATLGMGTYTVFFVLNNNHQPVNKTTQIPEASSSTNDYTNANSSSTVDSKFATSSTQELQRQTTIESSPIIQTNPENQASPAKENSISKTSTKRDIYLFPDKIGNYVLDGKGRNEEYFCGSSDRTECSTAFEYYYSNQELTDKNSFIVSIPAGTYSAEELKKASYAFIPKFELVLFKAGYSQMNQDEFIKFIQENKGAISPLGKYGVFKTPEKSWFIYFFPHNGMIAVILLRATKYTSDDSKLTVNSNPPIEKYSDLGNEIAKILGSTYYTDLVSPH